MSKINPNIFRAYDVRGTYPEELNEEAAFKIGKAVVSFLNAKKIVIGEDARLSSPSLSHAVRRGVLESGCDIFYAGVSTTPLLYFTVNETNSDGGIMITGSHIPPDKNGLKIVREESIPISSNSGLQEIKEIADKNFMFKSGEGLIHDVNFTKKYIDFLLDKSGFQDEAERDKINKLKIVIDASNGVAPLVLDGLLKYFNFKFTPLFFEIDGSFPNHLSDISRDENLQELKWKVLKEKADIGIAFDGDGDRMAVIDNTGEIIRSEYVLSLFFKYGFGRENSLSLQKTVYDHRFSRSVKELFGERGIRSKTGHSFIKQVMKENDADIGGEISGHFFFKEMKYADSAILAMLKLLKILGNEKKPIGELIKPFQKYFYSGEINIEISQDHKKLFEKIRFKYADGEINELDGVTVEYKNWWFNIRASNTEPLVRLVVEAESKGLMEEKVKEITSEIKKSAN